MDLTKYQKDVGKNRVVTQARLDVRHLAALANYFEMNGVKPQNRSHLVHCSIAILHDLLAEADKLEPIASVSDAIASLAAKGIEWTKSSKGHRQLVRILQEDHRLMEALNTVSKKPDGLSSIESEIERILKQRGDEKTQGSVEVEGDYDGDESESLEDTDVDDGD